MASRADHHGNSYGQNHLAAMRRAFERYFERVIPRANLPPRALHAAIRYSALSPGKRLRPLLALTASQAVGGRWQAALPAAAAVECVHAFSLVHDDLPAMDNDDYRRGRLTTHKKFGDALGILAGDALLALAFEELSRRLGCWPRSARWRGRREARSWSAARRSTSRPRAGRRRERWFGRFTRARPGR